MANPKGRSPGGQRLEGSMLRSDEVAEMLGVHPGTVRRWRVKGMGPAWKRWGGMVVYDRAEVERYQREGEV